MPGDSNAGWSCLLWNDSPFLTKMRHLGFAEDNILSWFWFFELVFECDHHVVNAPIFVELVMIVVDPVDYLGGGQVDSSLIVVNECSTHFGIITDFREHLFPAMGDKLAIG